MPLRLPSPIGRRPSRAAGQGARALGAIIALATALAACGVAAQAPLPIAEEVASHPAAALRRPELADDALARLSPSESCRLLTFRGEAELNLGRLDAARNTARRLETNAGGVAGSCSAIAATLLQATIAANERESVTALRYAHDARDRAQAAGHDWLWVEASFVVAGDATAQGEYDVAQRLLEEVLARAPAAGDDRLRSRVQYRLAMIYYWRRQVTEARDAAAAAWRHAVAAASPKLQAEAKLGVAAAAELTGDTEGDRRALEEGLAIARAAGSLHIERGVLLNLADHHLRHGEYRQARVASQRALELSEAVRSPFDVAVASANLGFAELMLGNAEAGRRAAERGIAIYEHGRAIAELASLLREYGEHLEHTGDLARALSVFARERSLQGELARARDDRIQRAMTARYEAEGRARQTEILRQRTELQAIELERRRLERLLYAAIAVAALLGLIVVLQLYRRQVASTDALAARNRSLAETRDIDPLTGLFNRRHFHEFMRGAGDPERRRDAPADGVHNALLLLDLDYFKRINDRYGHAVGDAVLVEVAKRLRDAVRDEDRVVRWGGEEFLIYATLRPGDRIHDIASRLLGAIGARTILVDGLSLPVSTSIGYLAQPLPPDGVELSWREAFDLVDMALYLAKAQGRNRGCAIVALPRGEGGDRPDLGHDLAAAALAGRVELHFEPGPGLAASPAGRLSAAA